MGTRLKKELIVAGVTSVITALVLIRAGAVFEGNRVPALMGVLAGGIVFWMALLAYALALITNAGVISLVIAITAAITLIVGKFSIGAISGALLTAAFMVIGQQRLKRTMSNQIKYRTIDTFYMGTRAVMSAGITALIGIGATTLIANLTANQGYVNANLIQSLLKPAEPLIQGLAPTYRTDYSVNELIEARLQQQYEAHPQLSQELIPQQRDQALQQLEGVVHTNISGQETIPSLIAKGVNNRIQAAVARSPLLFSLGVVAIIFLAFRIAVPLFVWPTLAIIAIFVHLSRRIGLAYIAITAEKVERLQL